MKDDKADNTTAISTRYLPIFLLDTSNKYRTLQSTCLDRQQARITCQCQGCYV